MAAATASKIPEALRPEVLAKAGNGEGSEAIAAWLLAEHGLKITGRSVRSFLAARREERAEVTKSVIAEKLGKTVFADLDAVDGILARARADEEEAGKVDDALLELERIALSDIGDAFDENGALKSLKEMPERMRRAIASLETEELRGPAAPPGGLMVKLKLWDKPKALEVVAKLRGRLATKDTAIKARDQQLRALELRFRLAGASGDDDKKGGVVILPAETD